MSDRTPSNPVSAFLRRVRSDLGVASVDDADPAPRSPVPLASRLATADLAWGSVLAVTQAAGIPAAPDPDRIALAYRSDRVLTIDGTAPDVWSPYSGFWRTTDGWVRTHGNYAHHALALTRGLGVPADPSFIESAIRERSTAETVDAVTSAGGLVVPVLREDPADDLSLRTRPLLQVETHSASAPRRSVPQRGLPLDGIRVLDLTRVIAGPVCTRTLAALGADVLRIDPPQLPEPDWQHLDTGHGKRTAILDARSTRLHELMHAADVVVLGYRPSALQRLGLSPAAIAERHPGVVVAQLSAWGLDHPERAGFDSLVQAESGVALIESPDGERPGALPAQALDHSAGYLLAAAVLALRERQAREGGTWWVHTSLRRIAAELLGMPRTAEPPAERLVDAAAHTATFTVAGERVTTARPVLPGIEFATPRPWGSDQPTW